MSASRESIVAALVALMQASGVFAVVTRRNRSPESFGPSENPAIVIEIVSNEYEVRSRSLSAVRRMNLMATVYNDLGSSDVNGIPETPINAVLDSLDAALKPTSPTNLFTLGGLVDSVNIVGEAVFVSGSKTGKSFAVVPIQIVMP